jgi:hypothetical protein
MHLIEVGDFALILRLLDGKTLWQLVRVSNTSHLWSLPLRRLRELFTLLPYIKTEVPEHLHRHIYALTSTESTRLMFGSARVKTHKDRQTRRWFTLMVGMTDGYLRAQESTWELFTRPAPHFVEVSPLPMTFFSIASQLPSDLQWYLACIANRHQAGPQQDLVAGDILWLDG